MSSYERIPTTIEAVQWDGTSPAGRDIIAMGASFSHIAGTDARLIAGKHGAQGIVDVPIGHWIARAAPDDFYPIHPDVFVETYRPANRRTDDTKTSPIHDRIDHDFAFHPATTDEKRNAHTSVREHCKTLAHYIADTVPAGREQALALTHIEEAMHWANAALAKANT